MRDRLSHGLPVGDLETTANILDALCALFARPLGLPLTTDLAGAIGGYHSVFHPLREAHAAVLCLAPAAGNYPSQLAFPSFLTLPDSA